MPLEGQLAKGGGVTSPAAALVFMFALSGCLGTSGLPGVSMFAGASPSEPAATASGSGEISRAGDDAEDRGETRSAVIDDLISRKAVVPGKGPYAEVAEAVLAANTGSGAAELRVARLKAEAKSKNWLPSIGPTVDLTSLGALAASILVEQVLFDNGKRKAEREFAAADVEVAAVVLSYEMNKRVHDGLSLYVSAARAQEQAALADRAVGRMQGYGDIMRQRVEGGLSDKTEQRVIFQKVAEIQSAASADRETATTAITELNAMSARDLSGVSGLSSLSAAKGVEAIPVLKSMGEGKRLVAEAKMQRAGFLPGLKASALLGKGGITTGVRASADQPLGFGTGASLEALEATKDVATQRVASARDESQRRIVALDRKIATLMAREAEGASVLRQTQVALDLFTEQYKVGRRPLLELVGMFETFSRMEREQAAIKYDVALLRLAIAQEQGVLVDGTRM